MSDFKCNLNGEPAWLPTETLRIMIHCVHVIDGSISLLVETAHIDWMMNRLNDKDGKALFIDIGAATGAASIPIALKFKEKVSIVAFEPATNANRLLTATLEKNSINSVTLVKAAVSDEMGEVTFVEYGADLSGECPWFPETSTIAYNGVRTDNSNTTTVPCVTIDSYLSASNSLELAQFNSVVVKIDVEGFEEHVLKGSLNFIKTIRPYFSIDIHARIGNAAQREWKRCAETPFTVWVSI